MPTTDNLPSIALDARTHTDALRSALSDLDRVDASVRDTFKATALEHLDAATAALAEIRARLT